MCIRDSVKDVMTPDLRRFLGGPTLFDERDLSAEAASVHDGALATLARLHDLPVQDAGERARIYRDELLGSPAYRQLKEAMDLWCACWFWPTDRLDEAPLPTTLAAPPAPTAALAARIAAEKRFFHWELEFPDVFRAHGAGFDAVVGNPPWETYSPIRRSSSPTSTRCSAPMADWKRTRDSADYSPMTLTCLLYTSPSPRDS